MRSKLLKAFIGFMALFIVLAVAETSSAQIYRNHRRGSGVSKQQIKQLLKRIENRSDRFKNALDKSLDRSRLDGTRAEDNINERAKELERATDDLRSKYDRNDTHAENSDGVRRVIAAARVVNRIMLRRNFGSQIESTWVRLRGEINALGRLYRLGAI